MIRLESGGVAQLGERTVRIRKVKGSNPSVSTMSSQTLTSFATTLFYEDMGLIKYHAHVLRHRTAHFTLVMHS